jgi:hypothetical protein
MNNKTAKQIVNEALNIAISKGCFGLIECSNIVKALDFLNEQPDVEFGEISHQEANEIRETKLG